MPETVKCKACNSRKNVNDVIEVQGSLYCDTYCLYADDPNSAYVSVPQNEREAFAKLAMRTAGLRAATAAFEEAKN